MVDARAEDHQAIRPGSQKGQATQQTLDKLWKIVELLVRGEPLPSRCRRHRLSGQWNRLWECHIESDWLLIWDEAEQTLTLVRTGTHADLFE